MTAKRQWVLVTALLCLAVLALGFMFLVKPEHKKASDVKTQTTAVQDQITQLRAKLATLTTEKKNIVGEQAKLAQYVQQLPKDPQEPTLLRSVQQAATNAKVDLTTLNPSAPTAYTPPAGTPGAAAAVPGLQVIPVQMTVTGSYFQLESFLDSIEGLQRSMLVNTFSISSGAGASSSGSSTTGTAPEITANIQAEVFSSTTIGTSTGTAGAPTTTTGNLAGSAS